MEQLKELKQHERTTDLERHVIDWLLSYEDKGYEEPKDLLEDLQHGGCSSGMVNHLIYTVDCVEFYEKYQKDIDQLLAELVEGTGMGVNELFRDWDESDPLARENYNKNQLAWFGFEETANNIYRDIYES